MRLGYHLFFLSVVVILPTPAFGWTMGKRCYSLNNNRHQGTSSSFNTALQYANNGDMAHAAAVEAAAIAGSRVGEVVQNGTNCYLLTGYIPVPSPKCQIYEAYPLSSTTSSSSSSSSSISHNSGGHQIQKSMPLIIKFSQYGVDHEYINYQRLVACLQPHQTHLFVQIHDKIQGTDDNDDDISTMPSNTFSPWGRKADHAWAMANHHHHNHHHPPQQPAGIVMERGKDNLRQYIKNHGPYRGDALRQAMVTVIQAVHALHSNHFVWTELKPENFVVTSQGIKGIDLESLIETNDLLQVYTAEACPPEFPIDDMYQTLPVMHIPESFDIWGLGLVLFEMATGKPFYRNGMTDLSYIQDCLRNIQATLMEQESKLHSVDPQAADIIWACLQPHAHHRPSCAQLLQHEYFQGRRTTTTTTNTGAGLSSFPSFFYELDPSASTHFGTPSSGNTYHSATLDPADILAVGSTTTGTNIPRRRHYGEQPRRRFQAQTASSSSSSSSSTIDYVSGRPWPLEEPSPKPGIIGVGGGGGPNHKFHSTLVGTAGRRRLVITEPQCQYQEQQKYQQQQLQQQQQSEQFCWKSQLNQVLDQLQKYAQEDPVMASDLKSILDQAKERLVRGSSGSGSAHAHGILRNSAL